MGIRAIVCGGRMYGESHFSDGTPREGWELERHILVDVLSQLNIDEMAQGGAKGADFWSKKWAEEHGVPCRTFKADWKRYHRAAGAIRNTWMLNEFAPGAVVALPGGNGTADMVKKARRANVPVILVDREGKTSYAV